ncbi:MAG: phosphoribosylanthranilate isomerase [Sphingomonadales bacterium]|nr:phosphoribosylanthranilate isomerase [Sphingomonadales bacterium]MDE2169480.1 phosphoribosylanthranilate isomerase [Sphingomonadales bacterium]
MNALAIKICGLSTTDMVDQALAAQATHIGLVFFPKSPRNVGIEQAAALAQQARGRASVVGLFVNPEADLLHAVRQAVHLDAIQLHGHETPAKAAQIRAAHGIEVWKAIGVRKRADLDAAAPFVGAVDRILYDAKPPEGADLPGGTGLRIDWSLMKGHRHPLPWLLAGGLTPDNVAEAIAITGAPGVDVSSGVESAPGVKDADKIIAFCRAARG